MSRLQTDPILTVEHLTMRFGGLVAINDLSLAAGRGEITALIGPNGAGKTTVFNCVTGFYKPSIGRLVLCHDASPTAEELAPPPQPGRRWAAAAGGAVFLLERMPDHEVAARA